MDAERVVSRNECRAMAEDAWLKMLNFATQGSKALGAECIARLEEKITSRAAKLEEPAKAIFLADMEEARASIFDEYTSSPDALKRRLGVGKYRTQEVTRNIPTAPGLVNVAVNTAVRATVWESIRAMFRAFR